MRSIAAVSGIGAGRASLYIEAGIKVCMETPAEHIRRYEKKTSDAGAVARGKDPGTSQRQEPVLEFIAYLYSVIRNDDGMVQVVDRALKERYGDRDR